MDVSGCNPIELFAVHFVGGCCAVLRLSTRANPGGSHINNKRRFSAPFLPDLLRFGSSSYLPFDTGVLQI